MNELIKDKIVKGLKFTSQHFHMTAEISAVRETQVDVILTPSDGNAWEEKGWDKAFMITCFEKGAYKITEPNTVNISVY